MKLIKLELVFYFDCIPNLKISYYESYITNDEKVLTEEGGEQKVRLNEIWMRYDNNINTPYWSANVVIENGINTDKIKDYIKRLYESCSFLLNNAKNTFIDRVDNFKIPDEIMLNRIMQEKFNLRGEGIVIKIDEFKEELLKKTKSHGEKLVKDNEKDIEIWNNYLEANIFGEKFNELMKKMMIIEVKDNYVHFKIKGNYIRIIDGLADKLSKELFYTVFK